MITRNINQFRNYSLTYLNSFCEQMYICFDQHLLMDRKLFIAYMFTWYQAGRNRYSVNIQLCSWWSKFRAQVMCFTLPKVTGNVPALYIEHDSWKLFTNLFYADPGLLIKKMCICWSEQKYSFIYSVQVDTVAIGEFLHSKKLKWAGYWQDAQHIQGSHTKKQRHNF